MSQRYGLSARTYVFAILCLLLNACATPTSKLKTLAEQNGFAQTKLRAEGFDLLVFDNADKLKHGVQETEDATPILHVYLEGDGTPWQHRTIIMADPTPRNPLMLRLMRYDPNLAVYVGRPCYNGFAYEPVCENSLWTSARYSDTVVRSMASAIRELAERHKAGQLWLMGHSGGGALAMLLAERLPRVSRVITLAGNLDTAAWTKHHRYTPLFSSMNPATAPPLRSDIWQWHLIGRRDSNIPPQLLRPVIMSQPAATGLEFAGFDHGCCWERIWPDVLFALEQNTPAQLPAVQFKFRVGQSVPLDNL